MKAVAWISAVSVIALVIIAVVFLQPSNSAGYHLREFYNIRTNYNSYRPSVVDRLRGIGKNHEKWDYHLQSLVALGAVQHERFVFTDVPYTREARRHIWQSANSNFPNAVMFTANYYDTNAPEYGVAPYVLEVWDVPGEMKRWGSFVEQRNVKQ
jgi:hypothetical protein